MRRQLRNLLGLLGGGGLLELLHDLGVNLGHVEVLGLANRLTNGRLEAGYGINDSLGEVLGVKLHGAVLHVLHEGAVDEECDPGKAGNARDSDKLANNGDSEEDEHNLDGKAGLGPVEGSVVLAANTGGHLGQLLSVDLDCLLIEVLVLLGGLLEELDLGKASGKVGGEKEGDQGHDGPLARGYKVDKDDAAKENDSRQVRVRPADDGVHAVLEGAVTVLTGFAIVGARHFFFQKLQHFDSTRL